MQSKQKILLFGNSLEQYVLMPSPPTGLCEFYRQWSLFRRVSSLYIVLDCCNWWRRHSDVTWVWVCPSPVGEEGVRSSPASVVLSPCPSPSDCLSSSSTSCDGFETTPLPVKSQRIAYTCTARPRVPKAANVFIIIILMYLYLLLRDMATQNSNTVKIISSYFITFCVLSSLLIGLWCYTHRFPVLVAVGLYSTILHNAHIGGRLSRLTSCISVTVSQKGSTAFLAWAGIIRFQ